MELKPLRDCPRCNAPGLLEQDNDHHGEWFNLGCSNHWEKVRGDKHCPYGRIWYTQDPKDLDAAIESWNLRATDAVIKQLKDALANICGRGGYMPSTDMTKEIKIIKDIAKTALRATEGL